MTSLRIAILTYSTHPRGGVIHAMEVAEALHSLGHDVCLFGLDKTGAGFPRSLDCKTICIPAAIAPESTDELIALRIREYVEYFSASDRPFGIYHAQDCISANALIALRDRHLIPHVLRTVHHVDEFNSPYLRACQERSILEADRCLCVSAFWQRELRDRYGIPSFRVRNGVNLKRYSPQPSGRETALKQQLGLNGSPIFLTVGGIEPRKNSIRLLQAFARVRDLHPNAQLVIAGGTTLFDYQAYRSEFFSEVERLNVPLALALVLPGAIPDTDMADLYRCADAFAFPSIKEGWGLVVLEAIASGLPVVTSNIAPFTEFLDGHQAISIEPHSSAAIAAGLLQVVNSEVAVSLVRAAMAVVRDYDWEASARLHVDIYQQILARS
ncbi:MAG: MSMEG_0565 family glycosyltransferase [Cyanobacteria bacterium J06642_2]